MKVLRQILQVRFKTCLVRHMVTLSTINSNVSIYVIVYALNQRGVSCMISTCGSTAPHQYKYSIHFGNDSSNVTAKEINQPCASNFLREYVPLID